MIPSLEESLRLTKNFVPSVSGPYGMCNTAIKMLTSLKSEGSV